MIDRSATPTAHPLFQARLDVLFERLPGLFYVSIGRSYDEQAYLRMCYETRSCNNGNPANLPGYSFHEGQEPDGYCLAVDLGRGPHSWGTVHAVAADVGLHFPVPREEWHCQPSEITSGTSCPGCVPASPFDALHVPIPLDHLELKGRTNMLIHSQTPSYLVQNRHSGLVMDVLGGQISDGSPVEQYAPHGGDNQRLYLDWYDLSTATCRLIFKHNGRVLNAVANAGGSGCTSDAYHGGPNQLWRLRQVDLDRGDGSYYYMIHSVLDGGMALDASPDRSMNFYLWPAHGGLNQQWRFQV